MFAEVLRTALGLVVGAAVGLGFGLLQMVAQERHRRRQENGRLTTGWTLVPGSMSRVAYLLIALVLVQVISPALFAGSSPWWISAGVAVGYSGVLGRHLYRRRMAARPPSSVSI